MFSEACVILFSIGLMATQSLLTFVSVVGKHPTGMLSCVSRFLVMKSKHMYIVLYYAICLFTVSMYRPVSFNHISPTFIPNK